MSSIRFRINMLQGRKILCSIFKFVALIQCSITEGTVGVQTNRRAQYKRVFRSLYIRSYSLVFKVNAPFTIHVILDVFWIRYKINVFSGFHIEFFISRRIMRISLVYLPGYMVSWNRIACFHLSIQPWPPGPERSLHWIGLAVFSLLRICQFICAFNAWSYDVVFSKRYWITITFIPEIFPISYDNIGSPITININQSCSWFRCSRLWCMSASIA